MKYITDKQHLQHLLLALACIFSFSSCEEKIDMPFAPFLQIEEESLNFDQAGADYMMVVRCNEEYTVKTMDGLEQWCTFLKQENGDLKLTISPNEGKNVRKGRFCIVAQSQSDTLSVAQLGWGKAILVSKKVVNINEIGEDFELDVTANVEYSINFSTCDWIKETTLKTRAPHEEVTTTHKFSVLPNKGEARSATVKIECTDTEAGIEGASFSVNQSALAGYIPNAPKASDDIQIMPVSARGRDDYYRPNRDFGKMIDGINTKDTGWLSNWQKNLDDCMPLWIEFTFDGKVDLDYIIYHPDYKSRFKDIEIYVESDVNARRSSEPTLVYTGTIPNVEAPARIEFDKTLAGVTKLWFNLTSYYEKELRCREMEFFQKSPNNFDYKTLFANPACTELKSGITEEDILNCDLAFFKSLAWYMYNNKYPREFRIADYKAYQHPDKQPKENKTGTYSLLDNPTGISVKEGENLIVMADLKGQKEVSLRVQNLDTPGEDGFGGDTYPLVQGINYLTMKNKGLIYVLYHTDKYETVPPVTLHFASGKVNGYFDSQNPAHEGRWSELLVAAVDKHFDVLGKYAHLTFPTSKFMTHTKNGKVLIDLYDELVYREQEFLGLEKYGRMFKNRSYFNVMYSDAYMYSTSYRTSYVESTLNSLCDETMLKANCWGPAHEVGHTNQTRPGLKWIGTTEVTNNITAQYIQTSVYNEPSRLQTQAADGFPSRYGKAWTSIIAGAKAHPLEGDVFCKLVPFWQLELYFGKVLGQTPMKQQDHGGFYPDVYEYVRKNANPATEGACQLEFVYNCCLAAKADLTDFFEKWGFLRKVDTEIDDYGKKQIIVTEADITNMKSRVAALGYSKLDVSLEYITDNTVDLYKSRPSVVEGTTVRNGNEFTMTGWKNVAAFEVKDNQGKLIYVSEGGTSSSSTHKFTITTDWKSGYAMHAVSATGERKAVNVQ